jgi:putative SOS response-associated peptidase YedK
LWAERLTDAGTVFSVVIITVDANKQMSAYHDRMPVILNKQEAKRWLSTPDESLLTAYRDTLIITHVSPKVNSTREDDHSLIQEYVDPQSTLF